MRDRYRRFSMLSDIEGMKNAIGEMKGLFFPKQPVLNKNAPSDDARDVLNEDWFIQTITNKMARHPDNAMEYPHTGAQGSPIKATL